MDTFVLLIVMVIIAAALGAFTNSQKFFKNLLWSLVIGIFVSWGYCEVKKYMDKTSNTETSLHIEANSVSMVNNTMDMLFILTASSNMERCGSRSGNVGKIAYCDNSIITMHDIEEINTQNSRDRPYDTS